jgi:phosphoribosylaminoimidazolecarboxamide formyltransferase/IMP cyclohydrolase
MAAAAGVTSIIQPGGSIRDKDSIEFCKQENLVMVITGMRHFRH